MNEPQLSAELKLRFKDRFVHMDDGRWLIKEWGAEPSEADFWDFIATALEEEREAMIEDFAKLKGVGKKTIEKMLTAQYANQLKEDR